MRVAPRHLAESIVATAETNASWVVSIGVHAQELDSALSRGAPLRCVIDDSLHDTKWREKTPPKPGSAWEELEFLRLQQQDDLRLEDPLQELHDRLLRSDNNQ